MTEIKNVKVYDLVESIIASGLAMRTEPFNYEEEKKDIDRHLKRCINLVQASKSTDVHCHDNFLTGIRVSFDIKYPQYLSPELQRYHFLDIVTSMSKMHRLSKISLEKCCNKYVDPDIIETAQGHIDYYNNIVSNKNTTTFKYWAIDSRGNEVLEKVEGREKALYAAFMTMVSNCPAGLELWMRVSTNYKQLQTIYYQRRNHRLKEDWGAIIDMIESLPYAKSLILGEKESTESSSNTSSILNASSRPTSAKYEAVD